MAAQSARMEPSIVGRHPTPSQARPLNGRSRHLQQDTCHICAIQSDATIACWGDNEYGQSSPPEGTFTAPSAGKWHACAIQSNGNVACWGDNRSGQSSSPEGTFIAIAASSIHTCGIRSDGNIACWGSNYWGQSSPPEGAFVALALPTAAIYSCALQADNLRMRCWGALVR
jgi:alpha-tubulin suppressor-like RCC1 family protein